MEENLEIVIDGDPTRLQGIEATSRGDLLKPKIEGNARKKRRRGKSKRKILKPFSKIPWQARKNDHSKRNNRFRKIVLAKTHAPFNNNQFLMEIHKPEPENYMRTPSARTRDSSFSIDSEDNYFYSLPEDEEEYLTKEFSSVYEDAQSERLSNMSKNDLIQEYLLLEAKYDTLVKRTERSKYKIVEEDATTDRDTSATIRDSMDTTTDKDTSGTSVESSVVDEPTYSDLLQRMKEQEEQIRDLQLTNEKLRLENDHLHQRSRGSSSADSESDSSSTSDSDSSSSNSVVDEPVVNNCDEAHVENGVYVNGRNGETDDLDTELPIVNGFHSPTE